MAQDEYLSIALLSAIQHQDSVCLGKCIEEISRPSGRAILERHAWQLAAEYMALGQRFLPVSVLDVEATLQSTAAMHDAQSSTLQ